MTTTTADRDRLLELVGELEQMSHRIDQRRPHSTRHEAPLDMAWHFIGQAWSGCAQAARYLGGEHG